MTRRTFFAGIGAAAAASAAPRRTTMGLTPDSFPTRRPGAAPDMIEMCAQLGAAGGQVRLPVLETDYVHKARRRAEELGLYLEVQTALAGDDPTTFDTTCRLAKELGATSMRSVCLSGRRYENFNTLEEWNAATKVFRQRLERSVKIAEKHRIRLGLENHKDWTVDQQVALLKEYESEYLGVCLDTGNNIALLDDPMEVVEKLAPYTFNTHLKDMGVQPYHEGFLLSEVPMGTGFLDMKRIVSTISKANPKVRFSLEMITRDPLKVPCMTDKYWVTFPDRSGKYLASIFRMVRDNMSKTPLPSVSGLAREERLKLEVDLVEQSITYARDHLGLV